MAFLSTCSTKLATLSCAALLVITPLSAQALVDDTKRIVTHCKQKWPANRIIQGYCKEENLNYENWLEYLQKSLPLKSEARAKVISCLNKHAPDYRKAYDCAD